MSLFTLVTSYLRAKWSHTLLHVILMAFGIALMVSLMLFTHQVKDRLYHNNANIDAVVGAKGSPLQLILSRFCCYFLFHPLDSRSKVQE
ncbi:MAG: hypothetical protein MK137_06500 [Rickettsiales bacterium]|nr:hypothetical protein [Rickettsiales bacterium]